MKTLRAQIMLSFGVVILLVIILSVNSALGINGLVKNSEEMSEEELPILIADSRLAFNIAERVALARGYMLTKDEHYLEDFNELSESSIELQAELERAVNSEEVHNLVAKSIEWREILTNQIFPAVKAGNDVEAHRIDSEIAGPLADELVNGFDTMANNRQDSMLANGIENAAKARSTAQTNFIIAIGVILLGLGIGYFMSRNISRPIVTVSERMERMAQGILNDQPLETNRKDEIGQQIHSINEMKTQIQDTLYGTLGIARQVNERSGKLTEATGTVSDSSNQIAATMEQLAAGSEAQAHTATNMAEMVGRFYEDVQHANGVSDEVVTASNSVLERTGAGNDMMTSSVEQMNEIYRVVNESVERIQQLDNQTKEISELVTVISEIAEQTNLLALNAAIEAARAGEQGKGFAVVAEEVKKLAEQVADSVNEITVIVDTVQEGSSSAVTALESGYHSVADGKQKVIDTGHIFEEITGLVSNMNKLSDELSEDLKNIEEAGGRLTEGVTEVASIAEESAAGVEETTASVEQTTFQIETISNGAEELAQLSNDLETSVNQFEIEDEEHVSDKI